MEGTSPTDRLETFWDLIKRKNTKKSEDPEANSSVVFKTFFYEFYCIIANLTSVFSNSPSQFSTWRFVNILILILNARSLVFSSVRISHLIISFHFFMILGAFLFISISVKYLPLVLYISKVFYLFWSKAFICLLFTYLWISLKNSLWFSLWSHCINFGNIQLFST